jgi:hypothetical protein
MRMHKITNIQIDKFYQQESQTKAFKINLKLIGNKFEVNKLKQI